jgi:hypothetical protein
LANCPSGASYPTSPSVAFDMAGLFFHLANSYLIRSVWRAVLWGV